jgi:hypothetical protein
MDSRRTHTFNNGRLCVSISRTYGIHFLTKRDQYIRCYDRQWRNCSFHALAVSRQPRSQLEGAAEGAAALTGNGVGVRVGVDAELKKKPVLVGVGVTPGVLRSMGSRLGVVTVVDGMAGTGAWTLAPAKEGNGELRAGGEDDGTIGGTTGDGVVENCGGKASAGSGLGMAGGTVHGDVTVTVTAESMKTVSMPFVPVDVKADRPPGAAGFGVVVGTAAGVIVLLKLTLDDVVVEVESDNAGVLEGTIPPKGNGEGTD